MGKGKFLSTITWALFAAAGGIITALISIPQEQRMVQSTIKGLAEDNDFKEAVALKVAKSNIEKTED